ncbi:MAG TPA: ring-cleaving dioxygenase [Puia sp.]|jgi:glyoxalase family protein|nr:ring-cleaving dioxygenase [Puia sp.]
MQDKITGIHHITAIAGDARRNLEFYTQVLGLRMVKKTVNFDDPGTYHFYYGNETGTPGTILTFFPWEGIVNGRAGTGMATEIGYSVTKDSLEFWADRFRRFNVRQGEVGERMGEIYLPFRDPDGLNIDLIAANYPDDRQPWSTSEVGAAVAARGFHSVTLTLREIGPTAAILTDVFGYRLERQEGNRYRYITDAIPTAAIVDLVEAPQGERGLNGGGTNHHVAFRVANEEMQLAFREKILSRGLHITPKINRDYFFSVYFREPGGVLFELATDNPGFTVDEPSGQLGEHLKLPVQYEPMRAQIEKSLPALG